MLSIAAAPHCLHPFQASLESHRPHLLGRLRKQWAAPISQRQLRSRLSCRVYRESDGGTGSGGHGGLGGGGGGHGDGAYGKAGGIGVLGSLWARYMQMLEEHPLIVKSLTAGILNLFADLVCQLFFEKVPQVDLQRLLSFTAIGLFMSGPGLHFWYGLLPKLITVPGFPGVVLRLAADQVAAASVMGVIWSIFISFIGHN